MSYTELDILIYLKWLLFDKLECVDVVQMFK